MKTTPILFTLFALFFFSLPAEAAQKRSRNPLPRPPQQQQEPGRSPGPIGDAASQCPNAYGPFKVYVTGYVTNRKPSDLDNPDQCDGNEVDKPASGHTDLPSNRRLKSKNYPNGGIVMVAIPKAAQSWAYGKKIRVISEGPFKSTGFVYKAMDKIGKLAKHSHTVNSPLQQIDISTSCEYYAKMMGMSNQAKVVTVCVEDTGDGRPRR